MFRKYASLETLEAFQVPQNASRRALRKAAHRVSFNYEPRPGYLYVRCRAISSRCNDNFDEFPAPEIKLGYKTFIGRPVFVNHHNDDHRRARGVIIDAALHEDRNPDGSPDTWVELLQEVDARNFPKLAKAILAGEVDRTSMGCDVQLSVCSACGNQARNPAEYCHHIPAMKGQRIFRVNASTGKREGHLVREICHGLSFFENSLLVEEPADPTAYFLGVDDRGLKATATQHGEEPPGWIHEHKQQADELASRHGHNITWKYRGEPPWKSSSGYVAGWQGECTNGGCDAPASQTSRAHTDKVRTINIREDQPGELKDMMPPFLRRRCKGTQSEAMRKGAPFAGYEDFEDCVDKNGDKRDPDAYCGEIKHRTEDGKKEAMTDDEIWKGLNLPKAEDTHREVTRQKGKDLAESLLAPMYEPYGGHENYMLHQHNESMMALKRRYEGNSGKFGFDHEDDGGEPYYEIKHPSGWTIRHYADGPHAEIRHRATPDESHEVFDIGDPNGPKGMGEWEHPPETFGHKDLKAILDHWHSGPAEETGGGREYLEGPHGDPRIRRWKRTMGSRKQSVWPYGEQDYLKHSLNARTAALGDVVAPPDVDTLRDAECPVCGDAEVFDGERCPICGFIAPPSMFRDPDLEVAKQMDLRGEQIPGESQLPGGGGLVDPAQLGGEGVQPGSPEEQLQHPDQLNPNGEAGDPGTPGDGVPDLFCPACGEGVDAGQPMSQVEDDPEATPAAGPEEGMPCPNCGMATLLSSGDMQQMEQEAEVAGPDAEGAPISPDELPQDGEQAPEGEEQQAVPGEEEEVPGQEEDADATEDQDDSAVDDEDPAAKKRDKNSKGARMNKAVEAAVTAQGSVIDSLRRANATLQRENFVLQAKLAFLAKVAGVEEQFAAIQRQADINNPAAPIPDPPSQPAYETTEQALAPETMDDVQRPGETPGSVQRVPAEQVDVPMNPGETLPTSPANQLVDVTAPTTGTNGDEVPLNERRIETDVRIGEDPLRASGPGVGGLGNDGTAFPWTMSAKETDALVANRTMASMRLARLRIQAGLATGEEFGVATAIQTDAGLKDEMIAHEIRTLEGMAKAAAKRERPAGLVPRAASGNRTAPSMASVASRPVTASYDASDADEELFLSA